MGQGTGDKWTVDGEKVKGFHLLHRSILELYTVKRKRKFEWIEILKFEQPISEQLSLNLMQPLTSNFQ